MCLGLPGRVLEILDREGKVALVDLSGKQRKISLALLPLDEQVEAGDYVLVNVGYAMSKIDEREVAETRDLFAGFGEEFEIAAERHEAGGRGSA